jgi:hypothetical protein
LADVPADSPDPHEEDSPFKKSKWFTRGWTLQELLAPESLIFFDREWEEIGTKRALSSAIISVTGIESPYLHDQSSACIAKKMSWASRRQTLREEDIAYCLLGIFGVNMPLLYGESPAAFLRLQTEIIKISDDESIFAWADPQKVQSCGLLAQSPSAFRSSSNIYLEPLEIGSRFKHDTELGFPFSMSNRGLQISLYLLHEIRDGIFLPVKSQSSLAVGIYVRAPLRCFTTTTSGNHIEEHLISVTLVKHTRGYSRVNCGEIYTIRYSDLPTDDTFLHTVFITARVPLVRSPVWPRQSRSLLNTSTRTALP